MKKLFCPFILSVLLLTACSSSYSQEDVDAMKKDYEAQIAELESQITELENQISSLSAVPSVPAGMSDLIYSYGTHTLSNIDSYIAGNITAQECHDNLNSLLGDLILSNKSKLSPTDSECSDIMIFCYATINRISDEDFSEYSLEDLENALSIKRDELAKCLYVK